MKEYLKFSGKGDEKVFHIEADCRSCGCEQICQVVVGPFGPHYAKALCSECGAFIKWVLKNLPVRAKKIKK